MMELKEIAPYAVALIAFLVGYLIRNIEKKTAFNLPNLKIPHLNGRRVEPKSYASQSGFSKDIPKELGCCLLFIS